MTYDGQDSRTELEKGEITDHTSKIGKIMFACDHGEPRSASLRCATTDPELDQFTAFSVLAP
jgi:hypothetical protein